MPLVIELIKIFIINFWVKFTFFYLPVPGWWNGINIIWQIVSLWVLQRSCSFSVIVEAVCSKLPQLSLFCYLFLVIIYCELFGILLNDYQCDLQCFIQLKYFFIRVMNSNEKGQLLFWLCSYPQWLQVSLQETWYNISQWLFSFVEYSLYVKSVMYTFA